MRSAQSEAFTNNEKLIGTYCMYKTNEISGISKTGELSRSHKAPI